MGKGVQVKENYLTCNLENGKVAEVKEMVLELIDKNSKIKGVKLENVVETKVVVKLSVLINVMTEEVIINRNEVVEVVVNLSNNVIYEDMIKNVF